MALVSQRTLPELKRLCEKYRLEPGCRGKKQDKTDYILCLRSYFLEQLYPNGVPRPLQLMLSLESPMLCKRYEELKPEEQEALWDSPNWYFEHKLDGVRLLLIMLCRPGQKPLLGLYSRNDSIETFLPIDYRTQVWFPPEVQWDKLEGDFILDTELICLNPNVNTIVGNEGVETETMLQAVAVLLQLDRSRSLKIQREGSPLRFMAFDCLYHNGWLLDKPLRERRTHLVNNVRQLREAGFLVGMPRTAHERHSTNKDKRAFFEALLAEGSEGVVAKNLNAPYRADTGRHRDVQVKIKRTVSGTLEREQGSGTIEGWVSGFRPATEGKANEGLVGALEFSVLLRNGHGEPQPHVIALVSGIPEALRRDCTVVGPDGELALNPKYLDQVAELDGQDISPRSLRIMHARILKWRPDRGPDSCLVDQDSLERMIL